jgi:integrase
MAFRTQTQVDKLKLPAGKVEHWEFDEDCTGLSVRLQGKARTWVVWYQLPGRPRRDKMKIGDLAALPLKEARMRAGAIVNGARDGADPKAARAAARARAADTFGALMRLYLDRRAKPRQRPRTYAETERYLLKRWSPLHDRPLDTITRRDLAMRMEQIRSGHGPGAAEKARVYLGMAYSWAMRQGLVEHNPVMGLESTPGGRRDRVLSETELRSVWIACEQLGDFGALVRMLMLTGGRRDEIAGMAWSELATDKALWTLPAARSKNRREHEVPLSRQALALIKSRPRPFLFGRDGLTPFSGYSKAKARLDVQIARQQAEQRLGHQLRKGEEAEPGDHLPAWTLHDIRRSVVTHMAELGIDPHVIEAVINHVSGHKGGVAGIYNKATYRPQKAAALQRWADWLEATVEGREPASNVRPMQRAG